MTHIGLWFDSSCVNKSSICSGIELACFGPNLPIGTDGAHHDTEVDEKHPRELEDLIQFLQQRYAEALQQNDLRKRIEYSGRLSVAYSSMDCKILADKWMDDFICNLERLDPGIKARIQKIRDLLPN